MFEKKIVNYLAKGKEKTYNLSKFIIWVVRVDNENNLKNAMPCRQCCYSLKKIGFRKIIYSTSDNKLEKLDLRYDMNNHETSAQKATKKMIKSRSIRL